MKALNYLQSITLCFFFQNKSKNVFIPTTKRVIKKKRQSICIHRFSLNIFIFHHDETGKSLNFLLPGEHRKSRNENLETKAAHPTPRRKHFSSEKPKACCKILWRSPAHSAKRVFPSCPHTSIPSLSRERACGPLATQNSPRLSDNA